MSYIDHEVLKRRVLIYAEQMADKIAAGARAEGVQAFADGPVVLVGPDDAIREYGERPWVAGVIGGASGSG